MGSSPALHALCAGVAVVFHSRPQLKLRLSNLMAGGCLPISSALPEGHGRSGFIAKLIEDALAAVTIDWPIRVSLDPDVCKLTRWETVRRVFKLKGAAGTSLPSEPATKAQLSRAAPHSSVGRSLRVAGFKPPKNRVVVGLTPDQVYPGMRVKHLARGQGTVVERMEDGRTKIRFDDGEEHKYKANSMWKVSKLSKQEEAMARLKQKQIARERERTFVSK